MSEKAYGPSGKEIVGCYERVYGCALAEVTRVNGEINFEYGGGTNIWWNSQEQVLTDRRHEFPEQLWVDADDNVWSTSELIWKGEE